MPVPDRSVEGESGACRFRKQQHWEGRNRACDDSVPIPVQKAARESKRDFFVGKEKRAWRHDAAGGGSGVQRREKRKIREKGRSSMSAKGVKQ